VTLDTLVHVATLIGVMLGATLSLRSKLDEIKAAFVERIHGLETRVVKLESAKEARRARGRS